MRKQRHETLVAIDEPAPTNAAASASRVEVREETS